MQEIRYVQSSTATTNSYPGTVQQSDWRLAVQRVAYITVMRKRERHRLH